MLLSSNAEMPFALALALFRRIKGVDVRFDSCVVDEEYKSSLDDFIWGANNDVSLASSQKFTTK